MTSPYRVFLEITLNSDDTRMSFLNKLDVNDLGVNVSSYVLLLCKKE